MWTPPYRWIAGVSAASADAATVSMPSAVASMTRRMGSTPVVKASVTSCRGGVAYVRRGSMARDAAAVEQAGGGWRERGGGGEAETKRAAGVTSDEGGCQTG